MVANPPESRIPPMAAGWFLRYRLALNPPKSLFSIRLHPSGLGGPHAVQKLLVDVIVDTFTGVNRYQRHKSAAQSACIASFRPLAITSGPGCHLGAFKI
jgi:hypothetical protein